VSQRDQQFATVFKGIIIFLVVLSIAILILALSIGGRQESLQRQDAAYQQALVERIEPVGRVNTGEPGSEPLPSKPAVLVQAAAVQLSGAEVVQANCAACHESGVMDAPKLGDKAAWEARAAQGFDTLLQHAIEGFRAMPPKGGNTALTDAQMREAVSVMLAQAGIATGSDAPADQVSAPAPSTAPAPAAASPPAPAQPPATPAAPATAAVDLGQGKQVYALSCFACHGTGAAGAPQVDDPAAWQARATQGFDVLVQHAIQGFKAMPPKGGNPTLSDEAVRSTVAYMLDQAGIEPAAAATSAPAEAVAPQGPAAAPALGG
jgi:cytochrome c5